MKMPIGAECAINTVVLLALLSILVYTKKRAL